MTDFVCCRPNPSACGSSRDGRSTRACGCDHRPKITGGAALSDIPKIFWGTAPLSTPVRMPPWTLAPARFPQSPQQLVQAAQLFVGARESRGRGIEQGFHRALGPHRRTRRRLGPRACCRPTEHPSHRALQGLLRMLHRAAAAFGQDADEVAYSLPEALTRPSGLDLRPVTPCLWLGD